MRLNMPRQKNSDRKNRDDKNNEKPCRDTRSLRAAAGGAGEGKTSSSA
jgi:hypothetical protein